MKRFQAILNNPIMIYEIEFFFESSKGAVCAGNKYVNFDQGVFILNSSNI